MGLISPGGENLLDFLELRQVLSTYDGDLRAPKLQATRLFTCTYFLCLNLAQRK